MRDLRYRLRIEVRSDSLEYEGRLGLSSSTLPSTLTLDSVGHQIRSVRAGQTPIEFDRPTGRENQLVLPDIPAGTPTLEIEFAGRVDDAGLRGFHVSPLGPGRLYTTYLEPAAARRVFPCLDRPDEKAVFEVEVTAPRELTVISNTPVAESTDIDPKRRTVRFLPTPPMATYLLYLGIGPFEEIQGEGDHPRVILAAAPGQAAKGRFALVSAERAVQYFSRYYSEPYPLPKLHLVAVPQFGTGAMENWGAIAFQEYLLLCDERSPVRSRMTSVEVICHEIAHQWFGDLVTMRWWNDLWLNESFATFVAEKASESLFPDWNPWDDFLSDRYAGALQWDALPHTHPVRVQVDNPDQIRQIFDEISYGKGASILRMAESYVGEEAFRRGVSEYLAAHRWGNADSSDLWRAIAAASDPRVEKMFADWVERPGVPVVLARLDADLLHLEQRRFTLLAPESAPPWPIPLEVRDDRTTHRRLFDHASTTIEGVRGTPIVNPGRTGFYRVRYEGPLRERVLEAYSGLPPVDRWGLVNDSLAFLLAGTIDLEEYLAILRRLRTETDPFVLTAVEELAGFRYPLVHRIPRWDAVVKEVVVAQSERLGLSRTAGESDRVRALREMLAGVRVRLDPEFARRLSEMYPRLESIDPDLVRPVLTARAATAGPTEYRELRARLSAETSGEARGNIAGALGLVGRDEWVREGLEMLLSHELLLGPWIRLFATAALANPDRSGAVWSFLSERADALLKVLAGTGTQGPLLQGILPVVGLSHPTEMRAFLTRREFPDAARAVTKALDLLELYERVLQRYGGT